MASIWYEFWLRGIWIRKAWYGCLSLLAAQEFIDSAANISEVDDVVKLAPGKWKGSHHSIPKRISVVI
jgi:hypothetical protein